jgi:DNA-binding MarR family transcriptional regulator
MAGLRKAVEEDTVADGLGLGELEHSAGLMLRIAQLTAFERFFALFGQSEIKISEFTVLIAVAENPGIRQGVLADVLKIKWSNMTKLVRTLEDRGLIARHVPRSDRRAVVLSITDEGKRQIATSGDKMYRLDREALSMLSDTEHAQLIALTRKVAGWPALSGM